MSNDNYTKTEGSKNKILKESLNYDNISNSHSNPFTNPQKNSNDSNPDIVDNSSTTNTNYNTHNQADLESKIAEATDTIRQHYQERLDIANDEISKLKTEINTLKISISAIGNQRDFYYNKLRDFEMLMHKNQSLDKDEILDVLKTVIYSDQEVELVYDDQGKVNFKYH